MTSPYIVQEFKYEAFMCEISKRLRDYNFKLKVHRDVVKFKSWINMRLRPYCNWRCSSSASTVLWRNKVRTPCASCILIPLFGQLRLHEKLVTFKFVFVLNICTWITKYGNSCASHCINLTDVSKGMLGCIQWGWRDNMHWNRRRRCRVRLHASPQPNLWGSRRTGSWRSRHRNPSRSHQFYVP